jgi:hypothetical protein
LGFATASRLVNIMVLNALLWVMIKIPRWAWSTISHSAGAGGRPSLIGRVVRAVIAYKTVGLIGGAAGAAGWAEKATRGLPGPLRMFSGAAGQRGANPGIPRMATPGTAGTAHAGAATRLAALARARGRARPRRASGVGAVFFLAPGPAEPTRYRSTRTIPQPGGDPGSGVRPVSFVEPVVAQPEAADRKRRYGGVPTVVPVFQAPTPSAASGPVTGAGTPTGTRRGRHLPAAPSAVGAPLWSHPTAPAPRQARTGGAASPVGSARVVFVDPTTSGRAAVGVRGYSSTAAPVVFSSPSRDTSTQYRPEQLRNPRFPQPPGPTPPRPTTRVGLPRHRPADPKPATGGSGSSRKIGE